MENRTTQSVVSVSLFMKLYVCSQWWFVSTFNVIMEDRDGHRKGFFPFFKLLKVEKLLCLCQTFTSQNFAVTSRFETSVNISQLELVVSQLFSCEKAPNVCC